MFLSRVRVVTEGLDRMALLNLMAGDAYSNHQLLWRMFTEMADREFLFRQEMEHEQLPPEADPRGLPVFYVVSDVQPTPVSGLLQTETKPLVPQLSVGDMLAFRLRANPTVSRKKAGEKRSRRHDVLMDAKKQCHEDQIHDPMAIQASMEKAALKWLAAQSGKSGFNLESVPQVSGYRQHVLRRKGRDIRFSSVDYEGLLTVAEPNRFVDMLGKGLGKSKAFGCGLMMVRRA